MKTTASISITNRHSLRRWSPRLLAAVLALAFLAPQSPVVAIPIMQVLELSREGALITYRVNDSGFGTATVAMCDHCGESIELQITPQTRLFIGGEETTFKEYPTADKFRVTVFYLPDENRLTRIVAPARAQ